MATNFVKRRSQWTSSEKNSAYSVNIRKRALGATLDANGNLSIYRPASGGGLGLHIEQEGTAACLQLTGGGIQPAYQAVDATAGAQTGLTFTSYGVTTLKSGAAHAITGTLADLTATDVGRTKTFVLSAVSSVVPVITGNFQGSATDMNITHENTVVVLVWTGTEWLVVTKQANAGVTFV